MAEARDGGRPSARGSDEAHHHGAQAATPESEALHRAAAHCHAAFAYCTTDASEVQDLEDLLCLIDCAELCMATAGFVARDSHYAGELSNLCAQQLHDVGETLADYPGDEVLQSCAQAVRDAYDSLQTGLVASE